MLVRKFIETDRQIVRKICSDTAMGIFSKNKKLREAIAIAYVDYYLDFEPQNVFVVEENGVVGGYCVCSLNPKLFQTQFPKYIRKIRRYSLVLSLFQSICLKTNKKYDLVYGAGFHINLDKNFQGGGIGTSLLSVMGYFAKKKGASHLYLITANKKTKGYGFYMHYGFSEIKRYPLGSLLLAYNLNKIENEHNLNDIQKKFVLNLD